MQQQINEQGLTCNVQLLGFQQDALSLIQAADIFILPSRAEPFGLVLLEAMALGKPVVACAAGGPLEIVEHGVTGLLVPPGEPARMSGALLQLLCDPVGRQRMGESGRRRYEALFTTEEHVKSHVGGLCNFPERCLKVSMRVLLVGQQFQVRSEGQPKAEQLALLPGIELRILVPDRYRAEGQWRAPEIPHAARYDYAVEKVVWPWTGPGQWYLHWYPRLSKVLTEFRPEIVDLWEEPWGLMSAHMCWLRNRLLPDARIISETEQNVKKVLPFPFEKFRAYTLRNASFVVGRNAEAITITRGKGYNGAARVVGNGVDVDLFRPMDREKCKAEYGFKKFVIGYVGRIVEQKGLMEAVEALEKVPDDVQLVFVGSGPFQVQLEHRAKELGKEGQIRFLPLRPREELPRLMNALDVLILPSRTTTRWKEQFGRVIIEAHACGTPVIGSDSGAIPEVIWKRRSRCS